MRRLPVWWLLGQLWRLALLVLGVVLLVISLRNAAGGSASWWLFGVGVAAGASIGAVALYWPWRPRRSGTDASDPPRGQGVETHAFLFACLALVIVVDVIGRYGAAVGTFLAMTGLYVLGGFARQWRAARGDGVRRREPPEP